MTAVILSGGNNNRIFADKAFLRVGGKAIVEREISVLSTIFSRIIIVTGSPERYKHLKADLTSDLIPGKGPLGGIYSGLTVSPDEYNFVVSCDLPFLNADLIAYMKESMDENDVVVPESDGLLEPLHAVYSKNCLPAIRAELGQGNLEIRSFYREVKIRYIRRHEIENFDPRGVSFFNVNTRKDLRRAREIALPVERDYEG